MNELRGWHGPYDVNVDFRDGSYKAMLSKGQPSSLKFVTYREPVVENGILILSIDENENETLNIPLDVILSYMVSARTYEVPEDD